MALRTFATFEADFPDDAHFAEDGKLISPGGFAIAAAVCEMLKNFGSTVSNPELHSFYGWTFFISDGQIKISFLLQCPGPWLLITQDRSPWRLKFFSDRSLSAHRRILETLDDLLKKDRRFQEIKWFTEKQFEMNERGEATPR